MKQHPATLYVLVGLPGSGKTTRARQLEADQRALRLTPDDWMIPLFGEPDADGKRFVLEGRFIWLASCALRSGMSVVLDFGVWSKHERSALRSMASEAGANCEVIYLPIDPAQQSERVNERFRTDPESTYAEEFYDLARFAEQFEEPDQTELKGGEIPAPPEGYSSWREWSAQRWPSSDA